MKSITAKRARRGPTSRTWCVAPRKPLFLRRRAPRLPGQGAGGGPDVVRRSLQTLIPSSPSTTSSGAMAPAAGRTWCAAPCKPLFLRRRAPRLPGPWRRRRAGRGAPLTANSYSFVAEHHVFRGHGAGVGVTRRKTMALRGARRQLGRPRAGRFRFFISNSMTFLRIRNN